jgi:aminoglycoside phosphotransferase family enzyme/predicted kinase
VSAGAAADPDLADHELGEVMAWLRAQADRVIETHIAAVFLIGGHAYKIKKAVDLGFLDFSTRSKRSWAIRRELDLNRRTAPDVYLAVAQVVRRPDGKLAFDEVGEPLESVLCMRRFDPEAVLSNAPARVKGDFAEDLGRQVAGLHASADVRPGGCAALDYVIKSNAAHLRQLGPVLGAEAVETLLAATEAEFETRKALLDGRGAMGQLRRCHGDLHLANILEEGGKAVLFDCIEFNDTLSEIDVLYDLAFLLMDLCFRGQADGATRALNGYLDEAARSFADRAWGGLAALPLFMSVRAAVRAHVNAHAGDPAVAQAYVQAAIRHLSWPEPVLHAVGGLSGSGKSTFARALAPELGAPPGAVILRSDEIRKRLWGRGARDPLPPEAYAEGQSERVYGQMLREAGLVLQAGRPVVLDAVFLEPQERAAAEAAAAEAGVAFAGYWLDTPPQVMAARIAARTGDASDADVRVLQEQLQRDPGEISWRRVDATSAPATES